MSFSDVIDYSLGPLTGVLALVGVFIQSKAGQGSLYDNRYTRQWFKKITKRGWRLIVISLVILGLTIWQVVRQNQQKLQDQKQRKIDNENLTKEINRGVADNSQKLFDDISKAFAKQGLSIDTLNKTISRLRFDSARNVTINQFNEPDPSVTVCLKDTSDPNYSVRLTEIRPNAYNLSFEICCRFAPATKVNIYAHILVRTSTGFLTTDAPSDLIVGNDQISKDEIQAPVVPNMRIPSNVMNDTLFILVFGDYSNAAKTKTYSVNTIFTLSISSKRPMYRQIEQEKEVRKFLFDTKPFVRNFFEKHGIKY